MPNYVVLKKLRDLKLTPVTNIPAVKGLQDALDAKQDTLVSGVTIKTIGNESLLGSGNIDLSSGGGVTSYDDLTNKPSIPDESVITGWGFTKNQGTVTGIRLNGTNVTITNGVADLGNVATSTYSQVQSDWNESDSSDVAYIKNKPTIPTVPTNISAFTNDAGYLTQHQNLSGKQDTLVSGSNIKTINGVSILGSGDITVSSGGTFTQTQADWNQSDSTAVDYIKNKPNIPAGVTVDQTYNSASTNAQSGVAVASAIANKQDVIDSNHKIDYSFITNGPDITGKEDKSNKVTSINAQSTDTQYPSAKCMYTIVGNIETLLASI